MTSKFNNSDFELNKPDCLKLHSRLDGNNNSIELKGKVNLDNSDLYHSPISTDATLSDSNSPWTELNNGYSKRLYSHELYKNHSEKLSNYNQFNDVERDCKFNLNYELKRGYSEKINNLKKDDEENLSESKNFNE
jgi:hypothetical protein